MRSEPRFSICELTLPDTSFEEDLQLIASVGAEMGVCETKLRPGEEAQQLEAFRASGLRASVCLAANLAPLPCEPIFPGPRDVDERMELMFSSLRRLAPFEPEVVVVVTGYDAELSAADARKISVEGLRAAAKEAAQLGITLGLEPIRRDLGLHISIPTTLRETVEWIEEIGEPNVGITHDVFNLFRSENMLADTERYAKLINSVHINDWKDPPRGNADRWFPGDGVIELVEIFQALERGGYEGAYDLEIFALDGLELDGDEALWRMPPEKIVERGRASFDELWAQV